MLDANILIAGVAWPRWPYEVLRYAEGQDFQTVLSSYIIDQARRRIQSRFPGYLARFELFLLASRYERVDDPSREDLAAHANLVRDATDAPVALAAINAKVDYLVSEDKDLTAHDESTMELRQQVRVLLSGTFLREVMGWSGDQLEAIRYRTWQT